MSEFSVGMERQETSNYMELHEAGTLNLEPFIGEGFGFAESDSHTKPSEAIGIPKP